MHIEWPEKWKKHKEHFLPMCLFNQLKEKVLCHINNIYAQECGLYSDKYGIAGRADCIAYYKGKLSIIDFKTSTKERTDAFNENYYIQGSAYAEMFGERTGIIIEQVVILVVTEDGTVQEFIKNKYDYLEPLVETIAEWRRKNEVSIDSVDMPVSAGMRS
jgi:genome maintenance exonuclease 1